MPLRNHYQAIAKPPAAITKPLPSLPLAITKPLPSPPGHYQAITKLLGIAWRQGTGDDYRLAAQCHYATITKPLPSHYQAITKPPLAITKPLPSHYQAIDWVSPGGRAQAMTIARRRNAIRQPLPSPTGHYHAITEPPWPLPSHYLAMTKP